MPEGQISGKKIEPKRPLLDILHKEIAYSVALIFMVIALNLTGFGLAGLARFHPWLLA